MKLNSIQELISDISKYASTGREIEDELFYDFDYYVNRKYYTNGFRTSASYELR